MKLKTLGLSLATVACSLASVNAFAYGAGDFWVRGGLTYVHPMGGHTNLNGKLTGARIQRPQNDHGFGFTLGYRVTNQIGVELLAAPSSFKSDYNVKIGATKVTHGSTRVLPPTLTAQYYPLGGTDSQVQPYVGAGATYSIYSSTHLAGGYSAHLKNTWGWAAQAGVDYMLTKHLGVNAAIWYLDSKPDLRVNQDGASLTSKRLKVNPIVFMTGLTWRF
ncbi:Outer membrane protein W [Halomonadaceae bacterium LMG 33818]|uniref:OmpW/AlkL family protein n=1 Tax=Cernens ardua TaxID=3402176 RepID=UPI003EDC7AEF